MSNTQNVTVNASTHILTLTSNDVADLNLPYVVTGTDQKDLIKIQPNVNVLSMNLKNGTDEIHLPYKSTDYIATSSESGVLTLTSSDNTQTISMKLLANNDSLVFANGAVSVEFSKNVIKIGTVKVSLNQTVTLEKVKLNAKKISLTVPQDITITDDSIPTVEFDMTKSPQVIEGNQDETSELTFNLKRSGNLAQPSLVNYAIDLKNKQQNNAVDQNDFIQTEGIATFDAGSDSASISLLVKGDNEFEPDESFTVQLSTVDNGNATIGKQSSATGIIENDDQAVDLPTIGFKKAIVNVVEGNNASKNKKATIQLQRDGDNLEQSSSVGWEIVFDSADKNDIASQTSGIVVFNPNSTSANINISIKGDTTAEADESFTVKLKDSRIATLKNPDEVATVVIQNDDGDDFAPNEQEIDEVKSLIQSLKLTTSEIKNIDVDLGSDAINLLLMKMFNTLGSKTEVKSETNTKPEVNTVDDFENLTDPLLFPEKTKVNFEYSFSPDSKYRVHTYNNKIIVESLTDGKKTIYDLANLVKKDEGVYLYSGNGSISNNATKFIVNGHYLYDAQKNTLIDFADFKKESNSYLDLNINANGDKLIFVTEKALTSEDTDTYSDIYMKDLNTNQITLVSQNTTNANVYIESSSHNLNYIKYSYYYYDNNTQTSTNQNSIFNTERAEYTTSDKLSYTSQVLNDGSITYPLDSWGSRDENNNYLSNNNNSSLNNINIQHNDINYNLTTDNNLNYFYPDNSLSAFGLSSSKGFSPASIYINKTNNDGRFMLYVTKDLTKAGYHNLVILDNNSHEKKIIGSYDSSSSYFSNVNLSPNGQFIQWTSNENATFKVNEYNYLSIDWSKIKATSYILNNPFYDAQNTGIDYTQQKTVDSLKAENLPVVSLTSNLKSVLEGNSIQYTASIDHAVDYDVLLNYYVHQGNSYDSNTNTDKNSITINDFQNPSQLQGNLVIKAGTTSSSFNIDIKDDNETEIASNETFKVELLGNNVKYSDIGNGYFTEDQFKIYDSKDAPLEATLSVDKPLHTSTEPINYTVTLTKPYNKDINFNLSIDNKTEPLIIKAGEISKTISVTGSEANRLTSIGNSNLHISLSLANSEDSNDIVLNNSYVNTTIVGSLKQPVVIDQLTYSGYYPVIFSQNSLFASIYNNIYNYYYLVNIQTGESTIANKFQYSETSWSTYDMSNAQISNDGRYVSFESSNSNLVENDDNDTTDVFIKDLQTGEIKLVSATNGDIQGGNNYSNSSSMSSDGRYITFVSDASNLVADDTNAYTDVFVKDVQTGTITRISTASDGTQGNYSSSSPSISSDGRYVTFESYASNLVVDDTNNSSDIFMKDVQTGTITRVSTASDGTQGNSSSSKASISLDGRYVAFESYATNLVASDDYISDIFVKDVQTGLITKISTASDGTQGNDDSQNPSMSSDGRYVAFESYASNLVVGDTNDYKDVFVKDVQTGRIARVSVASDGMQGNSSLDNPSMSLDGRYVTFYSYATNLTAEQKSGYFVTPNPLWDSLQAGMQKQQPLNLSLETKSTVASGWNSTLSLNPNQFNLNNMTSSYLKNDSILSHLNNNILAG